MRGARPWPGNHVGTNGKEQARQLARIFLLSYQAVMLHVILAIFRVARWALPSVSSHTTRWTYIVTMLGYFGRIADRGLSDLCNFNRCFYLLFVCNNLHDAGCRKASRHTSSSRTNTERIAFVDVLSTHGSPMRSLATELPG